MTSNQCDGNQELFLDILTKEEKEALLTKKMQEIRRKNEQLQKRHEEIQKDKTVADKLDKNKKSSPPQKDTKPYGQSQMISPQQQQNVFSSSQTSTGEPYKFTAQPKNGQRNDQRQRQNRDKRKKDASKAQRRPTSFHSGDMNNSKFTMIEEWNRDVQKHSRIYGLEDPMRPLSGDYTDFSKSGKKVSFDQPHVEEFENKPPRGGNRTQVRRSRSFHEGDDTYQRKYQESSYQGRPRDGQNQEHFRVGGNAQRQKPNFRDEGFSRQSSKDKKQPFHYANDDNLPQGRYNRQHSGSNTSQHSSNHQEGGQNFGRANRQVSGGSSGEHEGGRNSGSYGDNNTRQYNRQKHKNARYADNEFDQRRKYADNDFEPRRKRRQGAHSPTRREQFENYQGPPPDPAYNFLSDRSREQQSAAVAKGGSDRKELQRHPKNFGGADFSNVKSKMREVKEQQDRHGPPKSKMEMSIAMSGKERRDYLEWKAEREKVDQARIDRQKSDSGEWRREWDTEKNQQEDQEKRTEPAKRPAGRIGSGRFDRGERDERAKEELGNEGRKDVPPRLDNSARKHSDEDAKRPGKENFETEGKGRGRGRGRGTRRSGTDKRPQRVRTTSGEDRQVENQHDLLVIKLDNSPGKKGDGSVEVEYSDGESSPQAHGKSREARTSTTQTGAADDLWWDEEGDEVSLSLVGDSHEDDIFDHKELFHGSLEEDHDGLELHDDGFEYYDDGKFVDADEDEWEDCDDEESLSKHSDADSLTKTALNPDAPEFTPSSPNRKKLSSPPKQGTAHTNQRSSGSRKNQKPSNSPEKRDDGHVPKQHSKMSPKTETYHSNDKVKEKRNFPKDATAKTKGNELQKDQSGPKQPPSGQKKNAPQGNKSGKKPETIASSDGSGTTADKVQPEHGKNSGSLPGSLSPKSSEPVKKADIDQQEKEMADSGKAPESKPTSDSAKKSDVVVRHEAHDVDAEPGKCPPASSDDNVKDVSRNDATTAVLSTKEATPEECASKEIESGMPKSDIVGQTDAGVSTQGQENPGITEQKTDNTGSDTVPEEEQSSKKPVVENSTTNTEKDMAQNMMEPQSKELTASPDKEQALDKAQEEPDAEVKSAGEGQSSTHDAVDGQGSSQTN